MRMGPRDERSAGRTGAGLVLAGALALVGAQVVGDLHSKDTPLALVVGRLLIAVAIGLWHRHASVPGGGWLALALAMIVMVLVLNLVTRDAGGGAQVAFLLPAIYGAAFLRVGGASTVSLAAAVAHGWVVFALLPLETALTDSAFVVVVLVAVTAVLVTSGVGHDRLMARLTDVADMDTLTGLATRRALESRASAALDDQRSPDPAGTALILLDIDHFKRINDTYGHPMGDAVLVHLAAVLRDVVRQSDTVARMGGDELAVLMTAMSERGASRCAERVRTALLARPVVSPLGPVRFTLSVGVAHAPAGVTELEELYASADRALYQAKGDGRDRVVVGTPVPPSRTLVP